MFKYIVAALAAVTIASAFTGESFESQKSRAQELCSQEYKDHAPAHARDTFTQACVKDMLDLH